MKECAIVKIQVEEYLNAIAPANTNVLAEVRATGAIVVHMAQVDVLGKELAVVQMLYEHIKKIEKSNYLGVS